MVKAEAYVFNLELLLVLSELVIEAPRYFGLGLDPLVPVKEHLR